MKFAISWLKVSKSPEMQRRMLRRTLIALVVFTHSIRRLILGTNTIILSIWVSVAIAFKLSSVLEKVRSGNLFYNVTKVTNAGSCQFNPVIPKYVINRHFPKFKGYSRLSSSEVAFILQCPQRLRGFAQLLGYEQNKPFCRHRGVFSELRIRDGDEVATITRLGKCL